MGWSRILGTRHPDDHERQSVARIETVDLLALAAGIGPWDYWFLTPICIVGATLAMTVGIGGAVFFTPLFVLVLDLPPAIAVATAITTQLFGFLSGTIGYWRRRLIDMRLARRPIAVAVPAALLGSLLSSSVPSVTLRQLFGVVALFVAYRVFATRRTASGQSGASVDTAAPSQGARSRSAAPVFGRHSRDEPAPAEGAAVTALGGLLLGMISVGLAELQGYYFIARHGIPAAAAVATTIFVTLAALAAAAGGHLVIMLFAVHPAGGVNQTTNTGVTDIELVATLLTFTIPGVLLGGQLGPYIQARLNPTTTRTVLTVVLVAVGTVMIGVG